MKNIIIVVLLGVILLIVFGVIEQYELIDWEWNQIAIIAAGLAGPFQYMRNKLVERRSEEQRFERELAFKKIEYAKIQARTINPPPMANIEPVSKAETSQNELFNTDQPSYG